MACTAIVSYVYAVNAKSLPVPDRLASFAAADHTPDLLPPNRPEMHRLYGTAAALAVQAGLSALPLV